MIAEIVRSCFPLAAQAVADKAEDINKLNVFPVPDGDTGTNMSLTLQTVVKEVEELPRDASMQDVAGAITHGSLMGARGNSGVITSQILRGLAEGLAEVKGDDPTTAEVAAAFRRAVQVAFQAVRKPVEGTILTVLRDVSARADKCAKKKLSVRETLSEIVAEAYESVARTPDLLPVLKENGVVDSGAFGFATFLEGFARAILSDEEISFEYAPVTSGDSARSAVADRVDIAIDDDWEGSEFRYCTEFLFQAEDESFSNTETLEFFSSLGDCELCVGAYPDFKCHVHTNEPNRVLEHMLKYGQVFEVFIHNMDLEAQDRNAALAADNSVSVGVGEGVPAEADTSQDAGALGDQEKKPIGFVAVAAGAGQGEILRSLGVDVVVSGGQTMNPSTADILAAAQKVPAESIIVLPNNGNIRMAAEAAAAACDADVRVVPTRSVLQAFAALFAVDPEDDVDEIVETMGEAIQEVRDGEITTAVRDSSAADGSPIHTGDVMGIAEGSIDVVGSNVRDVTLDTIAKMQDEEEGDTLTILAGADMSDEEFEELCAAIQEAQPDLEIDPQRGDQPLYPVIFSIE